MIRSSDLFFFLRCWVTDDASLKKINHRIFVRWSMYHGIIMKFVFVKGLDQIPKLSEFSDQPVVKPQGTARIILLVLIVGSVLSFFGRAGGETRYIVFRGNGQ